MLLVKLAATGDVLRTTSLLPAIARAYPGAHVTWIMDPASAGALDGHPLIDRILTADTCLPALLTETFDVAYGLEAEARSAGLATLARAGRRRGFVCDDSGRVVPAGDSAVAWWLMGLDDGRKRANRRTYQALMYELCELPGPVARPILPPSLPGWTRWSRPTASASMSPLPWGLPPFVFTGPTSSWELELYGEGEVVHADVPCLGCYLASCDKPVTCMEQLAPEAVLQALERVRGSGARRDARRAEAPGAAFSARATR